MGTISMTMQRRYALAQLQPDYGVLGLTIYGVGPRVDERTWIAEVAERAMEEGVEAGNEIIRENLLPLPPLSKVFDWESLRLKQQVEVFREREPLDFAEPSRARKHTTIEETYPAAEVQNSIVDSFKDVWSNRVMEAMNKSFDGRYSAIHTVWWSHLYGLAVTHDQMLSDEQREIVMSESKGLAERVRLYIDTVCAPINQDMSIHDLYIAIATLGMLDYGAFVLVGRARFPRMFAALQRYADSKILDMRQCATIAFSRVAHLLRGKTKTNMVSESAKVLARTMRVLQRSGRDNPERDDLMEGLVRQAMLLSPHLKARDAIAMTVVLHEINGKVFSDAVMSKAQGALHELTRVRPRL